MKTPEQITDEVLAQLDLGEGTEGEPKSGADLTDAFRSGWLDGDTVLNLMKAAIEADRAQRNLIECIAEALDDRGAEDAAQLVRDTDPDDDLWNNYVGPMLDSIEDDYTRMAREGQD